MIVIPITARIGKRTVNSVNIAGLITVDKATSEPLARVIKESPAIATIPKPNGNINPITIRAITIISTDLTLGAILIHLFLILINFN